MFMPYATWVSVEENQRTNFHAFSLFATLLKIMAALPEELLAWEMVPSSFSVPGTVVKSHRPLISGEATSNWLKKV